MQRKEEVVNQDQNKKETTKKHNSQVEFKAAPVEEICRINWNSLFCLLVIH